MEPVFLSLDDVLKTHEQQIERYGGSAVLPRSGGAAKIGLFGSDSLPDAPEKIRDSRRGSPGDGVIDLRLFLGLGAKAYSRPLAVEIFGGLQELTPDTAAHVTFEAC